MTAESIALLTSVSVQLHEVASGFHKSDNMDACDRRWSVVEGEAVESVTVERVDPESARMFSGKCGINFNKI